MTEAGGGVFPLKAYITGIIMSCALIVVGLYANRLYISTNGIHMYLDLVPLIAFGITGLFFFCLPFILQLAEDFHSRKR